MTQRINLYIDELSHVKDPLSLNNIVMILGLVLVICLASMGGLFYVNGNVKQELKQVKAALNKQTNQL